ncbi:bifunctional helix-turn-helix transcriptional regulator/GNAT family N-acetyltransferase [Aliiglaciecola litoralis]|uniref:GNAT family N-acetyltransferase n=1 Tax=Aliiglaciecola litoralis TaxID=582857 RepID=A0ABP3WPH3_9ALTE
MSEDFLNELAELALGSRLKRISERMLADAAQVYKHFNMNINPKWFTLLALLDRKQQVSVVEASDYLGLSQPALSQFCRQLVTEGLIQVETQKADTRKKLMSLTILGQQRVHQMRPVWEAVDKAAQAMCQEHDNQFYQSLLKFERAHAKQSLLQRTIEQYSPTSGDIMNDQTVSIVEFSPDLASFFEQINRQWIEDMFVLEDVDKQVLQHPIENIISKGGKIWFAKHPELGIVGTCALLNKGNGAFELTKMGVLANVRGLKVGEILLQHVIKQAIEIADCLFLLTNAQCEAAIHLYEKNGFVHDKQIMQTYGQSYQRCNVAMRFVGDKSSSQNSG